MGPIGCLETSVSDYHYSLRNSSEELGSQLPRGGSLKSRKVPAVIWALSLCMGVNGMILN